MLEDKIKLPFKRRRTNKMRYSADKIYTSRAELKHTNKKVTIMLYIYNKQKLSIGRYMSKLLIVELFKEILGEKGVKKTTTYKNRFITILKNTFFCFNK
jgi:hypothetical protein